MAGFIPSNYHSAGLTQVGIITGFGLAATMLGLMQKSSDYLQIHPRIETYLKEKFIQCSRKQPSSGILTSSLTTNPSDRWVFFTILNHLEHGTITIGIPLTNLLVQANSSTTYGSMPITWRSTRDLSDRSEGWGLWRSSKPLHIQPRGTYQWMVWGRQSSNSLMKNWKITVAFLIWFGLFQGNPIWQGSAWISGSSTAT